MRIPPQHVRRQPSAGDVEMTIRSALQRRHLVVASVALVIATSAVAPPAMPGPEERNNHVIVGLLDRTPTLVVVGARATADG